VAGRFALSRLEGFRNDGTTVHATGISVHERGGFSKKDMKDPYSITAVRLSRFQAAQVWILALLSENKASDTKQVVIKWRAVFRIGSSKSLAGREGAES
jgi:hypothetical protein